MGGPGSGRKPEGGLNAEDMKRTMFINNISNKIAEGKVLNAEEKHFYQLYKNLKVRLSYLNQYNLNLQKKRHLNQLNLLRKRNLLLNFLNRFNQSQLKKQITLLNKHIIKSIRKKLMRKACHRIYLKQKAKL